MRNPYLHRPSIQYLQSYNTQKALFSAAVHALNQTQKCSTVDGNTGVDVFKCSQNYNDVHST